MTSPAASEGYEWEQLLDAILRADDTLTRIPLFREVRELGFQGLTIVDEACPLNGRPLVLTFDLLERHLIGSDSTALMKRRGHMHTPANTGFGSLEDVNGYGPAMAWGAGR